MRSRGIKPSFFTDEDVVQLSPWARLLFVGLWCAADREGRLEDRPVQLKIQLFPCDDVDVNALLDEIVASPGNLIHRYEVDGNRYMQVVHFKKHQSPHVKERASTIPAPCKPEASTVPAPDMHGKGECQHPLTPDSCLLTAAAAARAHEAREGGSPDEERSSSIEEEPPEETLPPYLMDDDDPMDALLLELWEVKGWQRKPKDDRAELARLGAAFPRADLATAIQQLRAKALDGAVKAGPRSALQAFVKQLHLQTPEPQIFADDPPGPDPPSMTLEERAAVRQQMREAAELAKQGSREMRQ